MPTMEWIGAGRRDGGNEQADSARLVNFYRENLNGKAVLKAVPGMVPFSALDGPFMQAMLEIGGDIYAAVGGKLYCVKSSGAITLLGSVNSGAITTISSNNGKVTVSADGQLFVFDGDVRTTPATGAFSDVGSVSFLGQRTVITERGGRRVQWSNLVDPSIFDADDFATAEQRDDNIIRGEAIGAAYWIFKEESIEIWYPTGAETFIAYQDMIEVGLKGFGLYCPLPDGGFFIGTDNVAYLISAGGRKIVSTRGVEHSIAKEKPETCFYYEVNGHKFCVLRFSDRPAWVYDVSMDEWHERAQGVEMGPWSAVAAVKAFGGFIVGSVVGNLFKLADVSTDDNRPFVRRAVSSSLIMKGEYFSLDALEFWGSIGQSRVVRPVEALLSEDDRDILIDDTGTALLLAVESEPFDGARIALRVSRDRGMTFGKYRVRSLGTLGDYGRVVKFRALGLCRSAVVEVTVTDDAPVTLDAQAEVAIS